MLIKLPPTGESVVTQYVNSTSITRLWVLGSGSSWTVRVISGGSTYDVYAALATQVEADDKAHEIAVALGIDWESGE